MRYIVMLEEGPESRGAYVTDLPGYAAAGGTRQETLDLIRVAVECRLDGTKEGGDPIPERHSYTEVVQVNAARSVGRTKLLLRGNFGAFRA